MINMIKLDFVPLSCEWIYSPGDAISALAVSAQESNKIFVYDGQGTGTPLHVFERLHTKTVVAMKVRKININNVSYAFYVTVLLNVFIIYSIILFMKHAFLWIKQAFWNIGQDQKWNISFLNVLHSSQSWTRICSNLQKIRLIHVV